MFSGYRRVDSGGRGGLQRKENAGKNVSPVFVTTWNFQTFIFVCLRLVSEGFNILSGRLVIIVSLGFGIVKPRLGPLLNR